jgi:hypothetical protein
MELKALKWELENNSRQPEDLTENRQSDSLNNSQLTLSQGDYKEASCCWWWWWWVRTNQASHRSMQRRFWVLMNPCSELSLSRPTMTTKERGGSSHHIPIIWWGRGRIRRANADTLTVQADFYTSQRAILALNRVHEISMSLMWLFCDWGRRIKLNFPLLAIQEATLGLYH